MPVILTPVDTLLPEEPQWLPPCDIEPGSPVDSPTTEDTAYVRDMVVSRPGSRSEECDPHYAVTSSQVFTNLRALPTIRFGTLIQWDFHPDFPDPGPYTFQLQHSPSGTNQGDDWEDIGSTASNTFFLIDDEQRVYGKTQWTYYRIKMTTPAAEYTSEPVSSRGDLTFGDRAIFVNMLRAHRRYLVGSDGACGALLRRRNTGTKCPDCLDELTGEVRQAECETCYGTGYVSGYYDPVGGVYAAVGLQQSHNNQDTHQGGTRGTIDDGKKAFARMLAVPQLFEGDIWIDQKNDYRYAVHTIKQNSAWRGLPVSYQVELRLIPFSDIIYSIDVPQHWPDELQPVSVS